MSSDVTEHLYIDCLVLKSTKTLHHQNLYFIKCLHQLTHLNHVSKFSNSVFDSSRIRVKMILAAFRMILCELFSTATQPVDFVGQFGSK